MEFIRQAQPSDADRIAEIYVFNYRLYFYPLFRCDDFYFKELSVRALKTQFEKALDSIWVYDDGAIKGFIQIGGTEIQKLFVEPVLQGKTIGSRLLDFAVSHKGAESLWALEKNEKAIRFYSRNGFSLTGERKPEEDTPEFLVRMTR